MDRRRGDRYAARFRWLERAGSDRARATAVLRTCLRFPRPQRGYRQALVVGRRWPVLVCQASGARAIHLAAGYGRNRLSDARAAFDAARRHRLAQAGEDLDAGGRGLIDRV